MTAYTFFLKLRAQAYNENVDAWDVVLNENFSILDFVSASMGSRNRIVSGGLVSAGTGLNADFTAAVAEIGGSDYTPAAGSVALTASTLNYIYTDSAGVVTGAVIPPTGDYCPLALVDANAVGIDRIGDARQFTPVILAIRDNLIINPEFTVNQEVYAADGVDTLADLAYGHDMWKNTTGSTQKYSLDASGNVDLDTIELGQKNDDILAADGKTVTFSIAAGAVQIFGLGVAAWATVTPSTPHTWTLDETGNSGWLELKKSGGDTFMGPKLEIGNSATTFYPRPVTLELAMCQRYFNKSYNQGTAPGAVTVVGNVLFVPYVAGVTGLISPQRYPVTMASVPIITLYSTATINMPGYARNVSTAADITAVAAAVSDSLWAPITFGTAPSINDWIRFQYTADARY